MYCIRCRSRRKTSFADFGRQSYKGSDACSSLSVTSNVWRFDKENGRTYHGYRPGVYYYPNDPTEAERLEYQHCVIDFALDSRLHYAPLFAPRYVLDIGTGTGDWAIEMGDSYPNATIEGTDLSPIQPTDVPANVQFVIDDAEQEDWAVPENHYDYIHTRFMMGCFADFREIIKQGFKHTKPGGWMESQDLMHPPFCDDGTMPDDWPFKDWSDTMDDASEKANRRLTIAHKLKRWYIEAGFVDVHEKIIKMPINSWPRNKHLKTLGKFWAENLLAGLQGFSLALFSREFMWSKTEIEVYLVNVRKSITDHRVHAYHKYYIVYGRKPELSPEEGLGALTLTSPSPIAPSPSDATPVPPRSPSPIVEKPSGLSSDPQNHGTAEKGPVASEKVVPDATDSVPFMPSLPQQAVQI
ncbi:S-adenosyl-L-methionine-dependent methyltransferase [Hyaloscypha finlandica]|nr:S-adenosyl-L-methionine-dependent methyltransferase [Hyaloscypha finlandica]